MRLHDPSGILSTGARLQVGRMGMFLGQSTFFVIRFPRVRALRSSLAVAATSCPAVSIVKKVAGLLTGRWQLAPQSHQQLSWSSQEVFCETVEGLLTLATEDARKRYHTNDLPPCQASHVAIVMFDAPHCRATTSDRMLKQKHAK